MESSAKTEQLTLWGGGFPCQPYSIAGKRKGKEDDRDLWPEMFRVIQELKPAWVVGENVANFANMELERALLNLESEGYEVQTFIIPAVSVGTLHIRQRVFVVAYSVSERRGSVEESWENRCINLFTKSDEKKIKGASWHDSRDLLLAGSRKITEGGSGLQRNDDGLSGGVDRLRSLGDAVVPQQVYPFFQAIVDIERGFIK